MPGLLKSAMQEPPQTPPNGGVSVSGDNLSPEKKQLMDRAFKVGKNLVYSKQVFGAIVQQIDQSDPAAALADAIVLVLGKIEQDKSIGQLPMDLALAVGLSLLGDIVDALTETGRGPFGEDVVAKALERGVQLWLMKNGGRFDPQELQAQSQQLQAYLQSGQEAVPNAPVEPQGAAIQGGRM